MEHKRNYFSTFQRTADMSNVLNPIMPYLRLRGCCRRSRVCEGRAWRAVPMTCPGCLQALLWPFLSSANPAKVVSSFGNHVTAGLPHIPMGSGHQWCLQSLSSSTHYAKDCTEFKGSLRYQPLSLTLLSLWSLNT